MRVSSLLRAGSALALAALTACADQPATSPSDIGAAAPSEPSAASAEVAAIKPALARMNGRLAKERSHLRVTKAELRYYRKGYDEKSATVIFANDRSHTLSSDWVPGDPRRDGRV